jgi:hypothetical protein
MRKTLVIVMVAGVMVLLGHVMVPNTASAGDPNLKCITKCHTIMAKCMKKAGDDQGSQMVCLAEANECQAKCM